MGWQDDEIVSANPWEQDEIVSPSPSGIGAAGGMGDVKMAEIAAGATQPPLNRVFPSAEAEYNARMTHPSGSAWQSVKDLGAVGLAGINDLASLAQRGAAAAFTDQTMNTPGAHALKAQTDSASAQAAADLAAHPELNDYIPPGGFGGMPMIMPTPSMAPALVDVGGRIIDDPVSYTGILAKTLSYIPKMLSGAGKAAEAVNKGVGFAAGRGTGAGEEALRYAGSPYGRARMEKWYGREDEIGADILSRLDDAPNQIPERAQKAAILEQMPPMSVNPTIEKGLTALPGDVAGRGLAPHEAPGYNAAMGYIDYLRGGPAPPDLVGLADEAGAVAQGVKAKAVSKGSQAAQDAKLAAQAERMAAGTQKKAGQAAAGIQKAKKDAEGVLHEWDRRDAKAAIDASVADAKAAAARAREAATNARARQAVGDVSEADAAGAEVAADAAERAHHVAQVAARLKAGEKSADILKDFSAQGMPRGTLARILKAGKARVESIKDLPADQMPAKDLDRLRQKLDPAIDWVSDPNMADIKDRVLKAMRSDISARMVQTAEASGNPEWAATMRSFHKKLESIDNMKDMIGKTGKVREKRIEAVVNNLFGKNKKWQQKFLGEFESNFGGNTASHAKAAQMAQQFGEGGKPGLLPVWGTGASTSVATNAALLLPRAAAAVASAGIASPLIASRVTLPMLTKIERGLKDAGIFLTPRAAQAVAAMKRPISDVQRARLATILAAELEAQMPANAIPFRQKVAEEDQPVDFVTRR